MGHLDLKRFYELLFLLERDEISAREFLQLQELLIDNPAAQDVYFQYIDVSMEVPSLIGGHGESAVNAPKLSSILKGEVAGGEVANRALSANDVALSSASASPVNSLLPSVGRWSRIVLAIAASFALIVGSIRYLRNDNAEISFNQNATINADESVTLAPTMAPPSVIVLQSAGAMLFRDTVPAIGGSLAYHRQYALSQGMLKLRFPSGAEVVLTAPSVVEIEGENNLAVKVGSCSVYAPPGAEGFRVNTPKSEVVDLGTRFAVRVNEAGETDVHVVEGAAEVREIGRQESVVTLRDHQSRRFGSDGASPSMPLEFQAESYLSQLPDRVVSYEAMPAEDIHVSQLVSVDVQRGGSIRTYRVDELIGVELIHFHAVANSSNVVDAIGSDLSGTGIADRLSVVENDSLLNSGVINPGGAKTALVQDPILENGDTIAEATAGSGQSTPGMAFRFRQPVVNGPGPDLVLFEMQSVADPVEGDSFHISPLRFADGLHSFTVRKFDIHMLSAEAKSLAVFDQYRFNHPPRSVSMLQSNDFRWARPPLRFFGLAIGIDLTELGYAAGAKVDGLFLQDADDDGHQVDPVLIAGLPEVKE